LAYCQRWAFDKSIVGLASCRRDFKLQGTGMIMGSRMIEMTSKIERWATRFAFCPLAVLLVLVMSQGGGCQFFTPISGSAASPSMVLNSRRFATPQDTADRLVEAVNEGNWRDEYECYTGSQQARFTYFTMVSTREVSDSPDLSAKVANVLQKFQFPSDLLERFDGQSLDLSGISDPQVVQLRMQEQQERREARLELWECDVQPLSIDWAGLIGELQPLLIENYQRHLNSGHKSQTGMVHHFDYHLFERASDIKVNGTRADGTIVAIVRDPAIYQQDNFPGPPKKSTLYETMQDIYLTVTLADRRLRRSPDRIEFVKEGDAWKVTSVPFR